MPVALRLTFPGGRYHATPWGRHVNEGVAEWPPSPWRLLRALVAVWRRTCPELPVDLVRGLLDQLVEPPLFHLPRHRVAHTRHYMPWEKKGPQDRTLVFDTFVSVGRQDPVFVLWPNAHLDADNQRSLHQLLSRLSSLGRAEAWVEASIAPSDDLSALGWNCVPEPDGLQNPIPLLCPDPATCFDDEHYPVLDQAKLNKGKIKPAEYLFDCPRWHLCLDTQTIHAQRWPSVPGALWVNYTRPQENAIVRLSGTPVVAATPTVARLLLDGPVLPILTESLLVGESVRRAVMSCFGGWCRRHSAEAASYLRPGSGDTYASAIFSGKDAHGNRLAGPGHTHYWPVASDTDLRRISGVILFARDGFGSAEVAAMAALRNLNDEAIEGLRVQLVGLGQASDLGPAFLGPSAVWQSVTPFLGHEAIGVRGRSRFLRKGLRREWRRLSDHVAEFQGVELQEVDELSVDEVHRANLPQSHEFRRARWKHGGREAYRPAAMYRLRFSRAIEGPFSLGYANHFGMGQFRSFLNGGDAP